MEVIAAIPEHAVLMLLVQFAAILLTARLFGELMQRIGQPAVLGELTAGILLGPSLLGLYWPQAYGMLFPPEALSFQLLELLSLLGLIFLLFLVGMETDIAALRALGRPALQVTLWNLILPFALGAAIGAMLPEHFMGAAGSRTVLALFLGLGMAVTAIPVLAKILIELNLLRRNFGLTALGAGIAEDLVGWICFPVLLDLAHRGSVDAWSVVRAVSVTLLFIVAAWSIGRRAVPFIIQAVDDGLRTPHRRVTAAVILVLAFAALTQSMGIHAVFGAFVAGVLVGNSPRFRSQDRETIEGISYGILSPIFFSFAGLQVRLHEMREWGFFWIILTAAIAGKVLGGYIGGRMGRLGRIESLAMGVGMNARGSMEVVLALLSLSAGIISSELFSMIVMMAVVTSLMTPPLLRLLAPYIPVGEDEHERLRKQAQEAQAMFKKKDMRLLVPTAGGPNAEAILAFVSPLAKSGRAALTLLFVRAPGRSLKEKFFKLLRRDPQTVSLQSSVDRLKEIATERGINVTPKIVTRESRQDAVIDEALQGYDILLLGAHAPDDPYGGDFLEPVVAESPVHVAVFRGAGKPPENYRRILLPTKGDALFPPVFEFAAMFAENVDGASITVLHASGSRAPARSRWNPLPLLLGDGENEDEDDDAKARMARLIGESIEDHAAAAPQPFKVERKAVSGPDPVAAILREAREGAYDLILVGAVKHMVRERLFFGHKVDEIARNAPCPVIVFTPKNGTGERSPLRSL